MTKEEGLSRNSKKKKKSILESLADMEVHLNIARVEGNTRAIRAIEKTMARLESERKGNKIKVTKKKKKGKKD